MIRRPCEKESLVLRDAQNGVSDPEIERHLASCQSCRNVLKVSSFMNRLASAHESFSLPSAREIWSRAQFQRRDLEYKRALRPMKIFESIAWAVAAGGPAAWLAWKWPAIQATVAALQRGEISAAFGGGSATAATLMWLLAGVAASSLLLTVSLISADD